MELLLGDCLEKLKEMGDNSVDSVVTDPPYGIQFMSKKWDYDVPQVEVWQEVLRVLKPGGHAIVACGTRTQHRMAVNLEDAGFEIRDIVAWVYGSGFPKSLNIGKAVDKLQGNEREIVGKTQGQGTPVHNGNFKTGEQDITKGTSEWEGWGTALKPAMELWTLCRKPLEERTIATNVLKYGTGGINIDGCRVEHQSEADRASATPQGRVIRNNFKPGETPKGAETNRPDTSLGRFPANFIHDGSDEVVELFPDTKPSKASPRGGQGFHNCLGREDKIRLDADMIKGHTDNGGSAARFFYCAKASKKERNKGLEGFEEKQTTGGGGLTANKREDGSYETASAGGKFGSIKAKQTNNHPTVKPVKLMRYLCRLITPKGGVILDPYMGSGTTGIGAKLEGFDFIGIEREQDYLEIAKARIDAWEMDKQLKI